MGCHECLCQVRQARGVGDMVDEGRRQAMQDRLSPVHALWTDPGSTFHMRSGPEAMRQTVTAG